jgi:hypothetical protein
MLYGYITMHGQQNIIKKSRIQFKGSILSL